MFVYDCCKTVHLFEVPTFQENFVLSSYFLGNAKKICLTENDSTDSDSKARSIINKGNINMQYTNILNTF